MHIASSFRRSIGGESDDERFVELVAELSRTSERFRSLWARHDIGQLEGGPRPSTTPVVGPIGLPRDKLPVGDLILVVYYPDAGSDAAEKIGMLASISNATHSGQSLAASPTNVRSDPAAPNTHSEHGIPVQYR